MDCYEQVGKENAGPRDGAGVPLSRIDHFEFPSREAVEKIKKLPVALTVQPGFSWLDKRYLKSYEQFLPKEKAEQQIPLKELAEAGVCICGSSDSPVQSMKMCIRDRRDIMPLLERLEFKMDYLKKPVASYSKGMRQRVSMARALLGNPDILFLDEPTSGLDPSGAVLFREIIEEERKKGTTVFLTTHNMLDADLLCDRVAFLAEGSIAALDTPESLKERYSRKTVQVVYRKDGERVQRDFTPEELGMAFPEDLSLIHI